MGAVAIQIIGTATTKEGSTDQVHINGIAFLSSHEVGGGPSTPPVHVGGGPIIGPPIVPEPPDPPKPPNFDPSKPYPPPPNGGWGYHPEFGWGYFPNPDGKPGSGGPKPPSAAQPK